MVSSRASSDKVVGKIGAVGLAWRRGPRQARRAKSAHANAGRTTTTELVGGEVPVEIEIGEDRVPHDVRGRLQPLRHVLPQEVGHDHRHPTSDHESDATGAARSGGRSWRPGDPRSADPGRITSASPRRRATDRRPQSEFFIGAQTPKRPRWRRCRPRPSPGGPGDRGRVPPRGRHASSTALAPGRGWTADSDRSKSARPPGGRPTRRRRGPVQPVTRALLVDPGRGDVSRRGSPWKISATAGMSSSPWAATARLNRSSATRANGVSAPERRNTSGARPRSFAMSATRNSTGS